MPEIIKKLSLNKHPADVPNYSLIQAKNMKLSNDLVRLVNEEGIAENQVIKNAIVGKFIVGIIPTSIELIIFCVNNSNITAAKGFIYRYNEEDNKCILVNDQWIWSGGKLRGTYTYNINNHLIVQLAEDPSDKEDNFTNHKVDAKVPLKTFDFDDWKIIKNLQIGNCIDGHIEFVDERYVNNTKADATNPNDTISKRFGNRADYVNAVVPQVPICNVTWGGLINGNAVKGTYTFFIRYKIDCWGNYTQWYPIGFPIIVDSIEKQSVSRYNWYYNYKDQDDASGHGYGSIDFYSNNRDFCEYLPKIRFKFEGDHEYLNFQKYQIGIVIKRLDTTKTYRSEDFNRYNIDTGVIFKEFEYIFNKEKLYDISYDELTLSKYNYYNVRNTINYQNRNYISNYTETNYNVSEKEVELFDTISHIEDVCKLDLFAYKPYIRETHKTNEVTVNKEFVDVCDDEFCYDTNLIQAKDKAVGNKKLDNVLSWEKVKGYDYGEWHRTIGGWIPNSHFGVPANEFLGINRNKKITVSGLGEVKAKDVVIYQSGGRDAFAWWNKKYADCMIGKVSGKSFTQGKQSVTITVDDKIIKIDGVYNWMSAYHPYLDYKTSFASRAVHKTLIPGEVYSFYIHFVDKYGHSTNGFKIPNSNSKLFGIELNQTFEEAFEAGGPLVNTTETKYVVLRDMYFNNKSKWRDYKLYQFINNANYGNVYTRMPNDGMINHDIQFGYYANSSGETFHRIPFYDFANSSAGDRNQPLVFGVDVEIDGGYINKLKERGYIGYYLSYEKAEPMSRVVGFASETDASEDIDEHPTNHDLDNLEDKNKGDYNGLATYYRGNNRISTGGPDSNGTTHKNLFVYSDDLNTSSRIKVDFNAVSFRWGQFDYRGFWQDQGTNKVAEYRANLNLPEYKSVVGTKFSSGIVFPIDEYEILIGDAPNNKGKGTRIQLKNPGIFHEGTWEYNAIATVWSLNNNIYTNPNKELIRVNGIKTFNNPTEDLNVFGAYPGCITFNSSLVFRRTGAEWNQQWTTVKSTEGLRYYFLNQGSYNVVSPQRMVQFPCYFHRFLESKVENNKPDQLHFILNINNEERFDDEKDTKRIAKLPNDSLYFHGGHNVMFPGRPVMPIQTLDMYKYIFPDEVQSDKLLLPYNSNLRNITRYEKTIRRSDVIQDESYVNAWRTFQPNGYKIITENKGNIVNLVGIGLYLLAHTEHSMFMFDRTAALQTQDKDVRLAMPDAFDTKYVEVYTSDKGFAGIQDRFAYSLGEFGYIFYNNDFHRLFKFDEKQIHYIDEDVRLWYEKMLPDTVRFNIDKYNNRLIICNAKSDGSIIETLSYHNDTKTFISAHDYDFKYGYNTKVESYTIELLQSIAPKQYTHENNYGRFNNGFTRKDGTFFTPAHNRGLYHSYVDIIFNDSFELIKFLEYIRYKVKKLSVYLDPNSPDNVSTPVEDEAWSNVGYANKKVPAYSGDVLRIFNEYCDTLDMNISINSDPNRYNRYKLPYFELGNWNFNYFRNNIPAHPGEISDRLRRMYGNKLVVRFIFNNTDNKRIEFETLDCIVTKQRNVR